MLCMARTVAIVRAMLYDDTQYEWGFVVTFESFLSQCVVLLLRFLGKYDEKQKHGIYITT